MRCHECCGSNVVLTCGRQSAERTGGSYDHGLVYSNEPLQSGEIFQLKIEKLEEKWAGSLRFGVTTINPNSDLSKSFRAVTDIFNSKEQSKKYWIWSGANLHHNRQEFALKLSLHSLVVNDVVGVQIRSNGELHIYQHGQHIQKVASGLPIDDQKLFVIFDVYGKAKKVCIEETGGTLKDLCRRLIKSFVAVEEIEELSIPKTLKVYLKT